MIRSIWNTLSFVATVNLLALLIVIGWLWQSGRLDRERVQAVRDLLSPTIAEAQQAAAEAAAADEAAAEMKLAALEQANPPGPSAQRLQTIHLIQNQEQQTLQRLAEEKAVLMAQLERRAAALEERETALARERTQWEQAIAAERERKTDAQFAQTVRLYASVPAKQAKEMLRSLMAAGDTEQAVAYLQAMDSRTAGKILREFKAEDEVQLAAELLERLRTFGLPEGDGGAVRDELESDPVDAGHAAGGNAP